MNFRDAELLSAYLDKQLSAADEARLEGRLAVDAELRGVLDDLRVARGLLRRVPRRRAPRNFTLNPLERRVRAPRPLAVPALRFAGSLAALLFVFTATINALAPIAARSFAAAPVPALGMGGGVGGGAPDTPMTEEAMALAAPDAEAAEAPPAELPAAPEDLAAPTAEAFAKTGPAESGPAAAERQAAQAPVPAMWLLLLAVLGILLLSLSWYIDRYTRRNFRSRVLEK
jgi:hypothetical protein